MVEGRRESNERMRSLLTDEETALAAAVREHYPAQLPELVISLGTGMRLSEQYGLTWSDVDMRAGVIHLSDTKNGSPRDIPMNASVRAAFEA